VTRNRVKRWLREAVRAEVGAVVGVHDLVIIAHPGAATAGQASLQRQLVTAFGQLG